MRSGLFLEEATNILERLVTENPDIGTFHYHLGEAYRKKGNSFYARTSLRKAIELEPEKSPIAVKAREALKLVSQ